jgi:hypothetical protein
MLLYDVYRNYIYMGFTLYTSYAYFFIENKLLSCRMITFYTLADSILSTQLRSTPDVIFHHALSLSVYFSYYWYSYSDYDINLISSAILCFQVSSIFLSIDSIFGDNYALKPLNSIAFIGTFMYYRIYNYYLFLTDTDFQIMIYKYNPNIMIIFYAFYTLNIYWACLIVKKIMKAIKINNMHDNIKTEWLLQYLLSLTIPISYYKYLKSSNSFLMLDLLGITILSVGNYKFHNNLYLNYKNNDSLEMKPFIYDHISIRVRLSLSLTSYCLIHNEFYNVLYACILNHIGSSIAALYYTKNVSIIEFDQSNLKCLLINWLYINITIESMLIGYMRNSLLNLYIIALLIGIVYKYKVFYNYTHIAFHVLLIIQTAIA